MSSWPNSLNLVKDFRWETFQTSSSFPRNFLTMQRLQRGYCFQEMYWVPCVKYSQNFKKIKSVQSKNSKTFQHWKWMQCPGWEIYFRRVKQPNFLEYFYCRRYVGSMVEGRMEGKGGFATGGGKGLHINWQPGNWQLAIGKYNGNLANGSSSSLSHTMQCLLHIPLCSY